MLKFIFSVFLLFIIVIDVYQYQQGLLNNKPEYSSEINKNTLGISSTKTYKNISFSITWTRDDSFMTSSFINNDGVYVKEKWTILTDKNLITAKAPINSDIWKATTPSNFFYDILLKVGRET